jgi:Kef-type K+ transport system membrane component KefB
MSNQEISILFFLQVAAILAFIRLVGVGARWIGQPQVVGEMIAGVLMGPSLFGLLLPHLQGQLFPKSSIHIIYVVAQIGIVLYMFIIGTEFNVDLIRKNFKSAISVSLAGIITPFSLGAVLALSMVSNRDLFPAAITPLEAMLFVGAALSITAFPMLARIIHERGIAGTRLGTLALAAGSMDDAAAWCILAIVLASFKGDPSIAVWAIGGGAAFGLVVTFVMRPLLKRMGDMAEKKKNVSSAMFAFIMMLLMISAWYTDYVGIYAVFGAFILGTAMPRGIVTEELQRRITPLTVNFLLPMFFIYSGLNTQLNVLVSPSLMTMLILVVAIATFGKGIACWAAARLNREDPHDAMAVGALMNARGLMELILLNIGLERGLITQGLFTIMVVMAIVTTLASSPLFTMIYKRKARLVGAVPEAIPVVVPD